MKNPELVLSLVRSNRWLAEGWERAGRSGDDADAWRWLERLVEAAKEYAEAQSQWDAMQPCTPEFTEAGLVLDRAHDSLLSIARGEGS